MKRILDWHKRVGGYALVYLRGYFSLVYMMMLVFGGAILIIQLFIKLFS